MDICNNSAFTQEALFLKYLCPVTWPFTSSYSITQLKLNEYHSNVVLICLYHIWTLFIFHLYWNSPLFARFLKETGEKKIGWEIKLGRWISVSNLRAKTTFYHICWLGFRQAVSFSKTMHLKRHCRVFLPLGLYNGMFFYQLQTQSFNWADKSYMQAEVWFYFSPLEVIWFFWFWSQCVASASYPCSLSWAARWLQDLISPPGCSG